MVEQGFDAGTVQAGAVTAHDLSAFPELEEVEYRGATVRAYRDRPASLFELFDEAREEGPDRPFLTVPAYDYDRTYAAFADRIDSIAAGLDAAGLTADDRLAVLTSNRPAFVELVFAAARLGVTVVPLNTELSAGELDYLLGDADPDVLVTEACHLATAREAGAETVADRTYVVDGDESDRSYQSLAVDGTPAAAPPVETDTAVVLYTSGTTGRPKGCLIDNFHVVNAALNNAYSFGFAEGTRSFVPTPLFHVSGLVSGLLSVLPVGGSVVVRDAFAPESFLETIEAYGVNYVMGVPTNYVLTVETASPADYDLASLETAAYGSAPMPSEMVDKLRAAFPDVNLSNTYGKTETTSGLASMCPDRDTDDRPGSVGLPTPAIEYRVVDADGETLPPGEVGELAVRGGIVIDEYLGRPAANETAFDDGWHFTGDVGVIDEEGFITLKGRESDMIIRGGKNVSPLEVEEVLAAHDAVRESSVVGFDDVVLGERVLAAVVPKAGRRVTEDALRAHCTDELADYKVPELFRVVDELPRNPNGKVVKERLLPEPLEHGIAAGE
ncbi:class I adenylate-forming enzyme family protein [Halobacteriales archaeon Cl-PHB]